MTMTRWITFTIFYLIGTALVLGLLGESSYRTTLSYLFALLGGYLIGKIAKRHFGHRHTVMDWRFWVISLPVILLYVAYLNKIF